MSIKKYLSLILILLATIRGFAQLAADAGNDRTVCPGASEIFGGSPTASGGLPPYTYSWKPTTGLINSNTANPTVTPTSSITYTVTVKDDTGAVQTDIVKVYTNAIIDVNAGRDTSICVSSSALIGGPYNNIPGITYSWEPGSSLNDSTSGNPVASPGLTSKTYTLTATISGCPPKIDQVTVSVIPTPLIYAGLDVTIQEGEVAILHATGGESYAWGNTPDIKYIYSESCDVEPVFTTTYYLYGTDATGKCPGYDDVTVFVEPSEEVVIYNTFTPNHDGNNDFWYIGNIYKYPECHLEVYNRYGKLVWKVRGYENNWDGKVSGEELPAATYFYDLDLGNGKKHHGSITIVR